VIDSTNWSVKFVITAVIVLLCILFIYFISTAELFWVVVSFAGITVWTSILLEVIKWSDKHASTHDKGK